MVQVDVFTQHRLQGNALAVFTDATGLSDSENAGHRQGKPISRKPHSSSRVTRKQNTLAASGYEFIPPPRNCPSPGHPTLGTAFVLRGASKSHSHHASI